jgi:hypothetical protein
MDFFFSINYAVSEYVNPATGKIAAGGNFAAFNNNWLPQEGDIAALADAVTTRQAESKLVSSLSISITKQMEKIKMGTRYRNKNSM